MGKRHTVSKREVAQRQRQRRKERDARREERRTREATSFEDMIAYVDEHGVITDTPPDPTQVEEIELEDISISTPPMEEVEEEVLRGRVEHYNSDRGYGFIKDLNSVNKYFFHISNAPEGITEGNTVTFELEAGQRGYNAVRIVIE